MPKPLRLPGRTFSQDEYWLARYSSAPRKLAFRAETRAEWLEWRSHLREKLGELAGPRPERVPLNAEVLESVDCGEYTRHRVVYDTEAHTSVPAHLLIPKDRKGERAPALICLHGHGADGKDNVAGVHRDDADRARTIDAANYNYGEQFARHGYITLCPDARGWGERCEGFFVTSPEDPEPPLRGRRDPCNVHFLKAQLWGLNLTALNLWDDMRGVDYLQSRAEVDPDRIGVVGLSFGGTRTMYLGAMDERLKAVDISCYLTSFLQYALRQNNFCGSQFLPGILNWAEVADVCALVAPRALLCESGSDDQGFKLEAAREGFETIRRCYEVAGVPERCEHEVFDGGHRFSGGRAFDFFTEWL